MAKKTETKKTESKNEMFSQFGEVSSAKELNLAADGFREEGDIESLKAFAVENGFTEEHALNWVKERETHLDVEFCDPITAAIAKLELEKKENKELGIFADDIIEYLESGLDDCNLAAGIRAEGKRLKEAAKRIWDEGKKNTINVNGTRVGYCGPMKGFNLIRDYYLGGAADGNA